MIRFTINYAYWTTIIAINRFVNHAGRRAAQRGILTYQTPIISKMAASRLMTQQQMLSFRRESCRLIRPRRSKSIHRSIVPTRVKHRQSPMSWWRRRRRKVSSLPALTCPETKPLFALFCDEFLISVITSNPAADILLAALFSFTPCRAREHCFYFEWSLPGCQVLWWNFNCHQAKMLFYLNIALCCAQLDVHSPKLMIISSQWRGLSKQLKVSILNYPFGETWN